MEISYIINIGIVMVSFFVLLKIAKVFISKSNSNSIVLESKIIYQAYITLVMGLFIIFLSYISKHMQYNVIELLFFVLLAFIGFSIIQFLIMFLDEIKKLIIYKRTSSVWVCIFSVLLKNAVIIYLVYEYYYIAL